MGKSKLIKTLQKFLFNNFWKRIAVYGRDEFYLFITLLFICFGYYQLGIKLILGLIISYLVVSILRLLFFRERPNKKMYDNIFEKIDASSFPSKHVVRVSILFMLIVLNFQNYLLSVLFFIVMFFVSISRLVLKRHHMSDVVFGVILGLLIGFVVNFI